MVMRYLINISFKDNYKKKVENIVYFTKTFREAMEYKDIIDNTVDKAIIKDNVTGKVHYLKH